MIGGWMCSVQAITLVDPPLHYALFLHVNQATQVQEIRSFSCSVGEQEILLTGLPRQIDERSLLIKMKTDHPLFALGRSLNLAHVDYKTLLLSSIGQEVVPLSENCPKKALLIGIDAKDQPILSYDGLIDFRPTPIAFPTQTLDRFPSLTLRLHSDRKQQCTCFLYYMCPLLSWKVSYLMELDLHHQTVDLYGHLMLHNLSGITFKTASVFWISNDPINTPLVTLSPSLKLPSNIKQTTPFIHHHFQPSFSYHLDMPNRVFISSPEKKWPIMRHVFLSEKDLPLKDLPEGLLTVYLSKKKGIPIHFVTQPLKKENASFLEIPLDTFSQAHAEVIHSQTRQISDNRQEITYYLRLTNTSHQPLSIHLKQPLDKGWDFVRAYNPPDKKTQEEVIWILSVPAKDTATFWYRITLPQPKS